VGERQGRNRASIGCHDLLVIDGNRHQEDTMPRYLVERSFPDGLAIPMDEGGAKTCQLVVDGNASEGSKLGCPGSAI
jgi:hypothetical protein